MKIGLSFSQMTPYLENKMILGIVISLLTLVLHCSVSLKEQLRATLCRLFFFFFWVDWVMCCQPFWSDSHLVYVASTYLLFLRIRPSTLPARSKQKKQHSYSKEVWRMLERGRRHRKREWIVKVLNSGAKLDFMSATLREGWGEREREGGSVGGRGREVSTPAVYGQCHLCMSKHWKVSLEGLLHCSDTILYLWGIFHLETVENFMTLANAEKGSL